jgi:hypothetical protein
MIKPVSLILALLSVHQVTARDFDEVYYEFGTNIGKTIPDRVLKYLKSTGVPVSEYAEGSISSLSQSSLILSFGNANLSQKVVSLNGVEAEGYHIETTSYESGSTLLACDGLPINAGEFKYALDVDNVHIGAGACTYAMLEMLGFTFLHPLTPYTPSSLTLSDDTSSSITENPYWKTRTWHIHTQHPLEFTEVLNGFDAPMFSEGESCPKHGYCETWEDMFANLGGLFEWLVANKQNRVEVLLLGNAKWDKWNDLSTGTARQDRLRRVTALSHEYGVLMGADIPLANLQQHGMAMVSMRDDFATQTKDIEASVDWAVAADFDFISTESGLSEFTKPTCQLMLQLFEVFTSRGTIYCVQFSSC